MAPALLQFDQNFGNDIARIEAKNIGLGVLITLNYIFFVFEESVASNHIFHLILCIWTDTSAQAELTLHVE